MPDHSGQITLVTQWEDDDSPFVAVDQFVLQQRDGQTLLVVGHGSTPLVAGSPKEQIAEIEKAGKLSIRVRGRFVLTKEAVERLRETLASPALHLSQETGD